MASKTEKGILANSHEQNKKKLSRTISKVVKSLSSLTLTEKNEQLLTLQKQLRTLDKQLGKQNTDELNSSKKSSKANKKKSKKSGKDKTGGEGESQKPETHKILPLGVSVGSPSRSTAVGKASKSSELRSYAKFKKQLKESLVSAPKSKKESSKEDCLRRTNESLTHESEATVANQKKSKKEKKKLKNLRELKGAESKSSQHDVKIINLIKVKEKTLEKSAIIPLKTETSIESQKSKKKLQKSQVCIESHKGNMNIASHFLSTSELYYYASSLKSFPEILTNQKSGASEVKSKNLTQDSESQNVNDPIKKPRKRKKKKSSTEGLNSGATAAVAGTTIKYQHILDKMSNISIQEIANERVQRGGYLPPSIKRMMCPTAENVLATLPDQSSKSASKVHSRYFNLSEELINCGTFASLDSPSNLENTSKSIPESSEKKNKKKRKDKKKNKEIKEEEDSFENYVAESEVFLGLQLGVLVAGQLRINSKDYNTAYVSSKIKSEPDYLIEGIRNRNRALEGDVVVLSVLPESSWKVTSSATQKTAKVVFIQEMVHSRRGIGTIKVMADKNPEYALFSPNDSRLPRWQVPMYCCPADFYPNPAKYKNMYFEGVLTNWITPKLSRGFVTEMLGEKGTIEAETMSILCEADCDTTPIHQSLFEDCLKDIVLDERIFKDRQDLRCECIFSIDPEGAKDLDDAMSCKKLENGNFEVGVHISDVAFYMQQGTPFDKLVCKKATTVYLVQRAYHMLPQELCYLCSLTPGEDKLAFSVFWEITPEAVIVSHRFTRSIIHSCTQLTYAHAQKVINNPDATSYDFPKIVNEYTEKDCAERITQLHRLATILRKNRFDNGALKIEIPKLWFKLDQTTGLPATCSQYILQESNWLIEEFMLLANFTVGKHIYETYPDIALLRHHKSPNENALTELKKTLDKEEVFIDVSSGAALYQSINQYDGDDIESEAKRVVLSNLIAKPMPKALYYSSGLHKEPSDFWHYALNEGFYTHFTSPIRRYADIIVHRLLAASLGYCPKPDYNEQEVQKAASISNKQKYCAKRAGEMSSKLFLTLYVAQNGPFIEKAAVMDIKDHSFDCVILRFGYIARVYTNNLKGEAEVVHHFEDGVGSIFIYWKENVKKNIKDSIQLIKLFSVVTVELKKPKDEMKLETNLIPFC